MHVNGPLTNLSTSTVGPVSANPFPSTQMMALNNEQLTQCGEGQTQGTLLIQSGLAAGPPYHRRPEATQACGCHSWGDVHSLWYGKFWRDLTHLFPLCSHAFMWSDSCPWWAFGPRGWDEECVVGDGGPPALESHPIPPR